LTQEIASAILRGMIDLNEARRSAGLKLRDVATALNVSDATASRWLNRVETIPAPRLRALAALLRVPVDVLLPPD
jgi:transcriptional regulator with XRE-family HTH domain